MGRSTYRKNTVLEISKGRIIKFRRICGKHILKEYCAREQFSVMLKMMCKKAKILYSEEQSVAK